jgi:ABC-2 type transport system permease protein
MKTLSKLTWVQFKLYIREPMAFFFTLVFPILLLILFGAAFGNEPDPAINPQYGFVDFYVPSLLALIAGTVGLMSVPVKTAAEREYKVLKRYRATPLSPLTFISADVLNNLLVNLSGAVLTVIVGWLVYQLAMPENILTVALALIVAALAFASLGYLIAALAPTTRIAQVVGMVLFFPMLFLSGVSLPREMFPHWMQQLSEFLPMTHAVDLLQGMWFGDSVGSHGVAWLVLLGMAVVSAGLGTRFFRWE